ncbi:hypothetical protein Tco_0817020 [Tanacetum coccineum]
MSINNGVWNSHRSDSVILGIADLYNGGKEEDNSYVFETPPFDCVGPPPSSVRDEDIHWLCENVIDLRPVNLTMLYEIGLTTIWKHVGHHLTFKDGERNVATSMSQFLKFPMAGGVRIGKGPALKENEIIVSTTLLPPFAFRKSIPRRNKSEQEDSTQSGSDTHHSASSLMTVIPDNVIVGAGGGIQILRDVEHEEEETGNDSIPAVNDVNEEGEINSPHSTSSPHSVHSTHSDRSLHFEDQHNVRSGDYDLHRSGKKIFSMLSLALPVHIF